MTTQQEKLDQAYHDLIVERVQAGGFGDLKFVYFAMELVNKVTHGITFASLREEFFPERLCVDAQANVLLDVLHQMIAELSTDCDVSMELRFQYQRFYDELTDYLDTMEYSLWRPEWVELIRERADIIGFSMTEQPFGVILVIPPASINEPELETVLVQVFETLFTCEVCALHTVANTTGFMLTNFRSHQL
jgi:hypothetical protein